MDDINTNLSDYTLDDLFSLLDININTTTDYNDLVSQINTKTNKYIDEFTKINKPNIVTFFKKVKTQLIEQPPVNTVEAANNIIQYDHHYIPNNVGPSTEKSDSMYNSNNGAGNPIHRKTVSKLYTFDSKFRENYNNTTSTNYSVTIPEEQNNVIEMTLCDLEFPSTYYPFNTAFNNNYMWIKLYVDLTLTPYYYYIYVPDGNYYYSDFINVIQTAINENILLNHITIQSNITYNNAGGIGTGTGTTSIGVITASDISLNIFTDIMYIELNFNAPPIPGLTKSMHVTDATLLSLYKTTSLTPLNQKLGWMLGYRKGLYNTKKLQYTSESILDIIGPKYLYLSIDDHQKSINSNFKSANKTSLPGTIMSRISLKGAAFNVQTQNDFSVYSEPRYYYGPVKISKFDIKMLDEFGRIVDINGNDFSFTLRMTVIYSAT